jgi:hypothetical protein
MNKSWFYLGLIGLALLTTSCGDSKPPTPAATPSPAAGVPPTAAPTPVAAAPTTPATATTPATTAAKPTDTGKSVAVKSVSVDVAAGLIPPTDGESWAKTVAKGRPDPFGMLALQPIEVIEPIDPLAIKQAVATPAPLRPISTAKQPGAKIATNNSAPVTKSVATKPATSKIAAVPTKATTVSTKVTTTPAKTVANASKQKIASNGKNQSVGIATIPRSGVNVALPKIIVALRDPIITRAKIGAKSVGNSKIARKSAPNNTSKPTGATALPAKNQVAAKAEKVAEKPLQAMAIEISGVIEVGGQTQVIIKLPTESFSRYISVGERIGNGKVLVKRVEGQNSLSPTVVLEEVGVEVARKIGDISSATPAPASEPVATPVVAPATSVAPVAPTPKTP